MSLTSNETEPAVTGPKYVRPGESAVYQAISDTPWGPDNKCTLWPTGATCENADFSTSFFICSTIGADEYSVTCLLDVSPFAVGGELMKFWWPDNSTSTIIVILLPDITDNPDEPCDGKGDPVGPLLGNFIRREFVLSMPGRGMDLDFQRFYDSRRDGLPKVDSLRWKFPLGIGWTHSYNIYIDSIVNPSDPQQLKMILSEGDGSKRTYDLISGQFRSSEGNRTILKRSGGSPDTLIQFNPDGSRYYFNQWRRISSIEDKNGNQINFAYSPYSRTGNLVEITDSIGRKNRLNYENYRIRRLYEGQDTTLAFFTEYRYQLTSDTLLGYQYDLTQVLKDTLSGSSVSLIVLNRYYYDDLHNIIQHTFPTGGYTADNDTIWNGHKNEGDRVSCWYDNFGRLKYQEVVNGDGDTILTSDKVIYKTFFEYDISGSYDSTVVYYYQGPASDSSHNPFDITFTPIPPTTNFFRKVIKFKTTSPNRGVREWE